MVGKMQYLLPLMLLAAGCNSAGTGNTNDGGATNRPIRAVATVGMVADIVRNVGGSHVTVDQLLGAGVDPHLYKATRDDVQSIMSGDIVFYSGLMLEGKMADTLEKIGRDKPVFAVTELIDPGQLFTPDGAGGHNDPHVWMDVSIWSLCVDSVANSLSKFDPPRADEYRVNADAYKKKLTALHEYGVRSIQSIPEERRVLLTSHDAFNYFGRAYQIEVYGIQGLSTESEAGLQRINELVDMLVAKKIKAVFVESSVSRKNIDALVEGVRSRGHDVVIGGELFSDAMGKTGTYEGTYIGMLDHNITLVTRALGGEAPQRGFNGQLSISNSGSN